MTCLDHTLDHVKPNLAFDTRLDDISEFSAGMSVCENHPVGGETLFFRRGIQKHGITKLKAMSSTHQTPKLSETQLTNV